MTNLRMPDTLLPRELRANLRTRRRPNSHSTASARDSSSSPPPGRLPNTEDLGEGIVWNAKTLLYEDAEQDKREGGGIVMGWDGDRDKRYSSEEGSAHDIRLLANRSKQQRHQSLTDVPRLSALPVPHLPRQAYQLHVYLGIDIMCRWCLPCVSAFDAPG
jgi:hypothetical protein